MMTCAVFIDGGYLEKVLTCGFSRTKISMEKLAIEMAGPDELLRAYYYHCLPYQSHPPTKKERERYSARHKFYTALSFLPRFEVRLGRLAFRGTDRDGNPIFEQKRIDCMVGVDMASLAAKGKITSLALFSGDSDFVPAIEAVKREGVLVKLWHGRYSGETAPSRELVQVFDERFELAGDVIERIFL